jgi:hypothetical protein
VAAETTPLKVERFGARVFLMANLKICDIDNVVLCGFSDLEHDLIPAIGGQWDDLQPKTTSPQVITTGEKAK